MCGGDLSQDPSNSFMIHKAPDHRRDIMRLVNAEDFSDEILIYRILGEVGKVARGFVVVTH